MRLETAAQAPGAKSLPAELKMRGYRDPWLRMRAQHPGVGVSGLGKWVCLDNSADSCYEDGQPTPSPTATVGGASTDWGSLFSNIANSVTKLLAVQQGGSVIQSGQGQATYGSPNTATAQAQFGGAGNAVVTPFGTASLGTFGLVAAAAVVVVILVTKK